MRIGVNIVLIFIFGVAQLLHAENLPGTWWTNSPRIKSVQFKTGNEPISLPVISLNGKNNIRLSFDMLFADETEEENMPWLRAKIEHRDAEWKPENISESEYLDGFNIADIGYGEPSIGGITTLYRHYETIIPPENITPKVSGNYLMHIYADSNPDSIFLTVPFIVEEKSAAIRGKVNSNTDIDYRKKHQQLEIEIEQTGMDTRVRPGDLKVFVTQNFDFSDRRNIGFPSSIIDKTSRYSHKRELLYPASNEYRRMEIIDNTTPMLNVDHIEWHAPFYHQILRNDNPRSEGKYITEYNHNGRYTIREYNSENSDLEADYVFVHFSLDGSEIPLNSTIHIEGDFTGRSIDSNNKMSWDSQRNIYYKSLLLKQGAYDYKYITPESSKVSNVIEGDFYETPNIYNIYVYYRLPGERYDRLASYGELTL